ncbi:MAG TPA: histidine phosphatase family protein [Candidatus Dormibacteraeota bacterium]|nr:histidine phosphatase family protein [Candidatus Dormibacteraeota bacterium]
MTRLYLVRHADVENPRRVLYGHLPGFSLSELGRRQAIEVGRSLRDRNVRRILHSPLDRAAETARLICQQLPTPVPLIADPDLREADFSRYLQGVPYWQIPLRRPLWFVHKARRGLLPGDEPIEQLGGRVLAVALRVAREDPEGTSVLVSHADPLQAAWVIMDGRPHTERELYRKPVDRAGVLEVQVEGDRLRVVTYVEPARSAADGRRPGGGDPDSTSPAAPGGAGGPTGR